MSMQIYYNYHVWGASANFWSKLQKVGPGGVFFNYTGIKTSGTNSKKKLFDPTPKLGSASLLTRWS